MREHKNVWLVPFRYYKPTMLENWLEQQANDGWVPKHVNQWSSLCMRFEKQNPEGYRYFYDLRALSRKDYRTAHETFGWEYVGQMASTRLWRKPYKSNEKRPSALSDTTTTRERDTRFGYAIYLNAILFGITSLALLGALFFGNPDTTSATQLTVAAALIGICTLILAALARRITRHTQ